MTQLLLIPDPRPLVERLGKDFFRQVPTCPGVYLMRDVAGTVLYVGKAKNLRDRLCSYRVANPDRMPRRHLRLLRLVVRIDLQECADESAALAKESQLLRGLRPRFNRAGTWPGPDRFLVWQVTEQAVTLGVRPAPQPDWPSHGPLGAGVFALRSALVRLLWCAVYPHRGLSGMPPGWFRGSSAEAVTISRHRTCADTFDEIPTRLASLFSGRVTEFQEWIRACAPLACASFEFALREADLHTVARLSGETRKSASVSDAPQALAQKRSKMLPANV